MWYKCPLGPFSALGQVLALLLDKTHSCPGEAHSQGQRDREAGVTTGHPRKEQSLETLAWVTLQIQAWPLEGTGTVWGW